MDLESNPEPAQTIQVDFTEATNEVDSEDAPGNEEDNEPSGNGEVPSNQAADNLSGSSEVAVSPAHLTAGIGPSDLETKKYDLFSLTVSLC